MALYGYGGIVFVASVVSFLLYGIDKHRAMHDSRRRIPERTLHQVDLFGGWLGGLLGRRVFRHKTQKVSFRIISALICVVHIAIVCGLGYATFG
ncbi:MAG: DUF1294 domain-containing protein [Planctomycetales bacterium]|nr:DUF1294 domain-containing protein [Planctomycetales bacterium]